MTVLEFKHVYKSFPGMNGHALEDVSLTVDEGEFVTILGSSGCGKTTLIKTVNRLIEPDSGEILLFGEPVKAQDPVLLRRKIGYVIQQIGLFPHMTVAGNIATIPKILKWDKEKIAAETDRILSLMNLPPEEFKNRYPAQLSGGQQQRIGLARAMICDPKVMLLDEPFGAIDAINRAKLQDELKAIARGSEKTCLFVTHDIREAFKLGTKTIIMEKGRIRQYAAPQQIAENPADDFVRELLRTSGMTADEAESLSAPQEMTADEA